MTEILSKAGSELLMVLSVGLVIGAGLPAIFSLGMRALTIGRPSSADGQEVTGSASPLGVTLASVCFGIIVAAIVFGIVVIVAGNKIFH